MKKLFSLLCIVFFALSCQANAEDTDKHWYVGGEIAQANQKMDDMKVYENGIDWTNAYDLEDELDTKSFGLFGGYKFTNGLRLEAKYNYLVSEKIDGLDNIIMTNILEVETTIHKAVLSIYYDYELLKGFSIFAGGGVGGAYTIPTSSAYDNVGTWGYRDKKDPSFGFVWELSAGIAYAITDSMDLTLQYTYSDFGNVDWENTGDTNGAGAMGPFATETDITIDSISLGIRYYF